MKKKKIAKTDAPIAAAIINSFLKPNIIATGTNSIASSGSNPAELFISAARLPFRVSTLVTKKKTVVTAKPATNPRGIARSPSWLWRSPTPIPINANALETASAIKSYLCPLIDIFPVNRANTPSARSNNKDNIISWQKNISIVPQSIFLNDATILENIAIAEDPKKINLEKIKQSTKIAQIDSFIENLPNKYNEKTGERGVKLSGGQRQRLGIARALYRNANLIILDEPTNALDAETEKKVMDSITNLEVTIIMISHSDTSLKYFNKVIDLNDFK